MGTEAKAEDKSVLPGSSLLPLERHRKSCMCRRAAVQKGHALRQRVEENPCAVSSNDFWSFWFNKGHLPGNISKDDKMEFRIQKQAGCQKKKGKKKSDASMTKVFLEDTWQVCW